MNCQWRPLNHNYPSSSSSLSSAQSLHEQFSRLSVNPETSTFLNLDRPSTSTTNTALDHQFHINQLRSYAAAQAHEITNFSGSSGLGLGSNSGLGSDFSVSSSPYPSFPRNFMNDLESSQGLYGYYSNVSHNGYYDTGLDSRLFSNNSNNGHHHNNYNGLNPRLPTHNSIINGLDQNYHQCNNYDTGLSPGYSNLYQADYNKDLRRLTSARNHNQSLLSLVWSERMRGEVVRLVKDKDSSQFLIKKFQAGHMEGVKIIVAEIEECIVEVLCDQTGSQFVQKLLKHLDFQDVHVLLKATLANVGICFDNQGTRAAQEILKYADKNNNEVQNIIVKAIRNVFRFANGCQMLIISLKQFFMLFKKSMKLSR
ncbi:Pumilio-like protein 12 [Bienertia sinuspersici]